MLDGGAVAIANRARDIPIWRTGSVLIKWYLYFLEWPVPVSIVQATSPLSFFNTSFLSDFLCQGNPSFSFQLISLSQSVFGYNYP